MAESILSDHKMPIKATDFTLELFGHLAKYNSLLITGTEDNSSKLLLKILSFPGDLHYGGV